MSFSCVKKFAKNGFKYYFEEISNIEVSANYTWNIFPRKVVMLSNERTWTIKQKSILSKLLCAPINFILPIRLFPKYTIYCDKEEAGVTNVAFASSESCFNIFDDKYIFKLCNDGEVKVYKNNIILACVHKNPITYNEESRYVVNCENNEELLALLTAFIDIIYFPTGKQLSTFKKEKIIVIGN